MARADQTEIIFRIVVERPVGGVLHSLQAKDDLPLDPKSSRDGEPLLFSFPVRVAPGPNSSAIRCAAKARCGGSSIFASVGWPATPPRPGRAG